MDGVVREVFAVVCLLVVGYVVLVALSRRPRVPGLTNCYKCGEPKRAGTHCTVHSGWSPGQLRENRLRHGVGGGAISSAAGSSMLVMVAFGLVYSLLSGVGYALSGGNRRRGSRDYCVRCGADYPVGSMCPNIAWSPAHRHRS